MTFTDMLNIGLMQGFAGLSLFSVLLLMGLGLADRKSTRLNSSH